MKRAIIIVLDSFGIGELPDARKYGDRGSNTLKNIAIAMPGFALPNLEKLGLGHIDGVGYLSDKTVPLGAYARMGESSVGKDTTTGHWEIAGVILDHSFPLYPEGFPAEIITEFEKRVGTRILGNIAASGTVIIEELGPKHLRTGYPIVYTSGDSVFQIAAHEEVIPVPQLYKMCEIAREILTGEHAVGRVIARPFVGKPGEFSRTDRRRDFSLNPTKKTVLDYAEESGKQVRAVGKIEDIFNRQGITQSAHTHGNMDGVNQTLKYMKDSFEGIIFTNLVDFDMLYGHRNNVAGYAKALEEFDKRLPEILQAMGEDDILFITADHGCDPTTKSTDHSREYTPLLVYGKPVKTDTNLGTRDTFADIAATISEYLNINSQIDGKSFLEKLIRD